MTHHLRNCCPGLVGAFDFRWFGTISGEMGIDMIDGLMREFDRNVACVVEDIMIRTDSMFWCCCFFQGKQ